MAPLKLFISQVRRHCLTRPPPPSRLSLSLRSLSSSDQSHTENPNPQDDAAAARRPPQSAPIKPVSYAVKPNDPDEGLPESPFGESAPPPPRGPREFLTQDWTREDIRYVKDEPSISPVAYPTRVAPLPEDKSPLEGDDTEERERFEMERERMRIFAADRARRRLFMKGQQGEEEEVAVPFPTIIQVEKKEKMQALELAEAIRQVKVRVSIFFSLFLLVLLFKTITLETNNIKSGVLLKDK